MDQRADFLIIGSGIAGLRAAAELADAGDVLVLTKAEPRDGQHGYAQGGIAAAVGADDSPALHAADTIAAGDGLCDEQAVDVLVDEGPRYVRELMEWGAAFDREPDGTPALAIEGAHSARRVLHARDATGREIGAALWRSASTLAGVRTADHARAVELVIVDGDRGRCVGARSCTKTAAPRFVRARAGAARDRRRRPGLQRDDQPAGRDGRRRRDGLSRRRAVADLEFVQFHPTALKVPGQPRFLLSEALRGEGARLVNAAGEAFMLALRSGRRSRAARSRRARHRAGNPAHRRAGLPVAGARSTRRSCTSGFR